MKGDTEVQDLLEFVEVECIYCGEKFKSQIQVKNYPNNQGKFLVCRADCGRTGKHLLNGKSGRKKFRKLEEL